MDEVDARRHVHPGRQLEAVDAQRRGELARRDGEHRADAQGLLDHGVDPRLVAGAHAREDVRRAGQALQRPGERARGRLVAGGQQGDQVVAQLGVVEPGGEQLGEHVVAPGARRAPARDERHELLVDHRHAPQERPPRAARPEVALGQRHRRGARQRARDGQRAADVGGQPLVAGAEHGPQDHVERELLHEPQRGDRALARPAREVLEGDLARDGAVAGDPLAGEGGEHEPPDAQVLGAVGEEDRARAGHGAQRPWARAALGDRRIGRVHRAHGLGMPDEDQRRVVEGEADGERLAVGGRAAAQEGRRAHDPLQGLQRGRLARPGRQGGLHRRPR